MIQISNALLLSIAFLSKDGMAFSTAPHRTFSRTLASSTSTTTLYGSKDNHRARTEKNLEDLMDRDWRLFRAKLVAQEEVETHIHDPHEHHEAHSHVHQARAKAKAKQNQLHDDRQMTQEKFGNIFAAIFHKTNEEQEVNIFDGNTVGGASIHSMIPDTCKDPFVTRAEIPVLLQPKVTVDKHRWAHPLAHIEAGSVLIANEKLGGVFHQTVVLVIEHNDITGSTGIVINRPLGGNLNKVASETESNLDLSLKLAFNASPVTYGGPVMQEEYSILHGYGEVEGSKKIAPGIFVGGSEELMTEVRRKNMDAGEALFVKGHAAWVPNQLSREVAKGVWYPASVSSDFILRYAGAPVSEEDNKNDLWADVLTCLGGKFADIATSHSSKGDRRMTP